MGIFYIPQNVSVLTESLGYKVARKEVTFAATVPGNQDLFTVTGDVKAITFGVCTTVLAGALAVLAVGCVGETNIIGGYTLATDIDAGDIWWNDTPDSEIEDMSVVPEKFIADGNDIILYYKTANVTSGVLAFYCFWTPLSAGASVVAA